MIIKLSSYDIQTAIERFLKQEYNLDLSNSVTESILTQMKTKAKNGKKLKTPQKTELAWFGIGEPVDDEPIDLEIFVFNAIKGENHGS